MEINRYAYSLYMNIKVLKYKKIKHVKIIRLNILLDGDGVFRSKIKYEHLNNFNFWLGVKIFMAIQLDFTYNLIIEIMFSRF